MRLVCPTCKTGLEVPDGTTALVRCPGCRSVFEAALGLPPAPSRTRERRSPRVRAPRPAPVPAPVQEEEPGRYLQEKQEREAEIARENRQMRREFRRAALGCRILWGSFVLYGLSLLLQLVFLILAATAAGANVALLVGAGVIGAVNWILATVGVAVIISGPDRSSARGYAIAALVAAVFHLALLGIMLSRADAVDDFGDRQANRLILMADVPTQYTSLSAYLTWIVYHEQGGGPRRGSVLYVLVGLAELLRLLFVMLTFMSLARAAGYEELGYQCIRAGAVVLFIVGGLVLGLLGFVAMMWETGMVNSTMGKIVSAVAWMGMQGLLAGMLLIPTRRAVEVAEACEAPILLENRYR